VGFEFARWSIKYSIEPEALGWVKGGRGVGEGCLVKNICIENKKNHDGFKIAGKLFLVFFYLFTREFF
jgi:hypothetical protein